MILDRIEKLPLYEHVIPFAGKIAEAFAGMGLPAAEGTPADVAPLPARQPPVCMERPERVSLQQIIPPTHRVKSGKKNMRSSRMKNAGLKCIFIRLI